MNHLGYIFKKIFIFFLFRPFFAYTQFYDTWYQAGLTAKVVSARMTIDSDLVSISETDPEIGYQLGGFFRINIDNIYLEPQLLIFHHTNKVGL